MLREKNLGTFGHMITKAYQLLKDDPALLEEERRRTRFLLVDEFQDANFAQVEILSLLAGTDGERFCSGRSGPGDLPVSRRFERSVHAVRQEFSGGASRRAGEESPLALADFAMRVWHCE